MCGEVRKERERKQEKSEREGENKGRMKCGDVAKVRFSSHLIAHNEKLVERREKSQLMMQFTKKKRERD